MSDSETAAPVRVVAGRYRLVRELGRGGMATVWLADDQLMGRPVAVKELRPPHGLAPADGHAYAQRALREARSAASIHHPHAVTVHDILPATDSDDAVYLIMEYVDGPTLAQLISSAGRQPPAQTAAWALQLLSVLEAAHSLGITHRDVKPANIIITGDGQAKLTDFGIAHTAGDTRLTGSGVMGTQAYLAPELLNASPITPAADLWSLGATLYAAAEGYSPFDRESTAATLHALLFEPLPIPTCPPPLATAITGLLQRDPAHRATIGQIRQQLQQATQPTTEAAPHPVVAPEGSGQRQDTATAQPFPHAATTTAPKPESGPGYDPTAPWQRATTTAAPSSAPDHAAADVPTRSPARRKRRRLLATITVTAAVVAAAVAVPLLVLPGRHKPGPPGQHRPVASPHASPPPPAPAPSPALAATLADPGSGIAAVESVAFSPDGQTLATGDEDGSAYLWNLATDSITTTLTDPQRSQGVFSVAFSPDGKTLAAGDSDGNIDLWDVATGHLTATLTSTAAVGGVAFSPSGQTVAAADDEGNVYLWNVATGRITATMANPAAASSSGTSAVAFSPNGQLVAVGSDHTVAGGDVYGTTYVWNVATGHLVATLADKSSGEVNAIAFSPDSQTLAASSLGFTYLWDVAGNGSLSATLTQPGTSIVSVDAVAFSPNGKTLATGDLGGSTYLWSVATDAQIAAVPAPSTGNPDADTGVNALAFSPDGQKLAVGDDDDKTYLYADVASGQ